MTQSDEWPKHKNHCNQLKIAENKFVQIIVCNRPLQTHLTAFCTSNVLKDNHDLFKFHNLTSL